jgi:hypothetical protein
VPQPPQPQELYEWLSRWPRWFGTPEDLSAAARKIDDEVHWRFREPHFQVLTTVRWGTATLASNSRGIDAFGADLRAHREQLTSAGIQVLAIRRDSPYPTDIDQWPTKPFVVAHASASEVTDAPALVDLQINAWDGASLRILTKSGLGGNMLDTTIRPYIAHTAGRLPPRSVYRGPVRWLVPRFEMTTGSRRWVAAAKLVGGTVGFAGGLAGIVSLIVA